MMYDPHVTPVSNNVFTNHLVVGRAVRSYVYYDHSHVQEFVVDVGLTLVPYTGVSGVVDNKHQIRLNNDKHAPYNFRQCR